MATNKVYPNAPIKRASFEMRFPNLFSMETKIPNIQLAIMEKFPEANLKYEQQYVITKVGEKAEQLAGINDSEEENKFNIKTWEFISEDGTKVIITSNNLIVTTTSYTSYNSKEADKRFRDTLKYILDAFFEEVRLTIINRIGLRYINEFKLETKTNEFYNNFVKTTFPTEKFKIEDANLIHFQSNVNVGDIKLNFVERFIVDQNQENKLIFDIDASLEKQKTENEKIKIDDIDRLHDLIDENFFSVLNDKAIEDMEKTE